MADNDETKNLLKADPELEAHVKKMGESNLHPVIEKIQHKFGVLNLVRNVRNKKQKDLDSIDQ